MNNHKYYQLVGEASQDINQHPGLLKIQKIAEKSRKILDVGCGEGSKLNHIVGNKKTGFGVDVNSFAIAKAIKQYPRHSFLLSKDSDIPFPDKYFDFVYSTFVLEHTDQPNKFIDEMIRVTKKKGKIAFLCPNYGAPNRRSPVSLEKPITKLFKGFLLDFLSTGSILKFAKVTPQKVFRNIDDDTTCEPYLLNLSRFLKNYNHLQILEFSSLWEIDDNAKSFHQKIFKYLGKKNIFPFKYWGPQLFIVVKKI
jgi:SAM-dependent methyltransferase